MRPAWPPSTWRSTPYQQRSSTMRRHRHRDDDDDIVPDGGTIRVPMFAMDSVQRSVARSSVRVTDGSGGTTGLHRPGFRIAANDARKTTTVRDPRGRLLQT